jgi:SAM domain (Sterile alpha motif)
MDVLVWLQSLGLEQYETLFRENDIDVEVLSDLTDGDIEKIGVSLGHRKRLLKAVAALAGPVLAPPTAGRSGSMDHSRLRRVGSLRSGAPSHRAKGIARRQAIGLDEWRTSSLQRRQLSKEAFAYEGVISNGRCLHR